MISTAAPDCNCCASTGVAIGFAIDGKTCPCVALCFDCGEPIAWEHDDARRPVTCDACEFEGLATFLISYEDTTGVSGPEWTCAYVDATSEAAAPAVIDSWGCDSVDATVTGIIPSATDIPHTWHLDDATGSIGAASRAEARRFYREQAGDLS